MRRPPLLAMLLFFAAQAAWAKPTGPAAFCDVYPDSSTCAGRGTTCTVCHTSTAPATPAWNNFGLDVMASLSGDFDAPGVLADALHAIEGNDDDGDSLSNLEEILLGTLPGDPLSNYAPPVPGRGDDNLDYDVDVWDPRFALRRAMAAYCGTTPTYDEMLALAGSANQRAFVHTKVDACLTSTFWTTEGLSRMADERIRPLDLGTDFLWDYRLWRYVLTSDRDIRELLTADYHVREQVPGQLVRIEDVVNDGNACAGDGECASDHFCNGGVCTFRDRGQALVKAERAGMIGTTWFHEINTMFSSMPRTTAAQAMRGYLGVDIARQQGIRPIDNEPLDVDGKGVAQAECAQCHATLDPAAYVFAKYRGIEGAPPSTYDPNRPIQKGLWTVDTEPQGFILGQPVSTLREWAAVAAESDAFMMTMARMFFDEAVGRPPGPAEKDEFDALWPSWPSLDVPYSANRFIHALVDTNAFGAP